MARGEAIQLSILDRDLDLDARLNGDRGNLFNNLRGRVQVNQALVDAHFKRVPGLGAFTIGGFARRDAEDLGGHADGALDAELLVLGTRDQIG